MKSLIGESLLILLGLLLVVVAVDGIIHLVLVNLHDINPKWGVARNWKEIYPGSGFMLLRRWRAARKR